MLKYMKQYLAKYAVQTLVFLIIGGLAFFAYSYYRDQKEERQFSELIGTKVKYE